MKLVPKTRKGKNKIAEAGTDRWHVVGTADSVQCLGNRPGLLIRPTLEHQPQPDKRRWILAQNDPDFELVWGED